jgi:hypothetical protein
MQYQHLNAGQLPAEPASVSDAQGTCGHYGVVTVQHSKYAVLATGCLSWLLQCRSDLYKHDAMTLLPRATAAHSTALSQFCAEVLHVLLMLCFKTCTAQQ